jgi:transposase-like protein
MRPKTQAWLKENIGSKFGKLTFTGKFEYRKSTLLAEFLCDCGVTKFIVLNDVKRGATSSCGCSSKEKGKLTTLARYGVEHALQSKEIQEKAKATNLQKYGTEYPTQTVGVQEKKKQTNLERYGTEHTLQSPEIREKIKATNLERYGVEVATQSPLVQQKTKQTNLEKYGTACSLQAPKAKEKSRQAILEKYGVEYITQAPKIKERIKQTNLERYGVEFPAQSTEIKDKIKQTNLEKYGVEYSLQSPEIAEQIKKTNTERHGVANPFLSEAIRQRIKQTNIEKYGEGNPFSSSEIKEKIKQTNLERLGVEFPTQSPAIKEKICAALAQKDYSSGPELELADFIRSLGYNVAKSYCGGANPCEIDIKVTDQTGNTVLCLEYNGDYFHSEARSGHRNYHLNKTEACILQKKTHLIHVFDSEWQTKQEIVKNFIRSKLEKGVSIRASKCEVREITQEVAFAFCEANHLQGRPNTTILCLGLFYDGQLLSVATFSKPHRQNMEPHPHLSRYAILPGFRIHGGLSKLSQYAYHKLGEFITFVHYRLSDGKSYEKAGYTNLGLSKPDYWYWDTKNHKVVSKQSRKKSVVKTPPNVSESEHAAQDGLYKIWDCGKIKFIYSPK